MNKRRGGVGVAVAHGFLYAFGGHDAPASNPSAARFDCVERYFVASLVLVIPSLQFTFFSRYDPLTDAWAEVTLMRTGRDAMGVAFMGDKLFIVGGFDGQAYLNNVEAYDPLTNTWQQVIVFFNLKGIFLMSYSLLVCSVTFGARWCVHRSREGSSSTYSASFKVRVGHMLAKSQFSSVLQISIFQMSPVILISLNYDEFLFLAL